jgi:hypothetical protein
MSEFYDPDSKLISVYHPLLQKQIPIAIMEAEGEKTENVELFWYLFMNEAISKISENTSFNPIGWCTDMSGALISGIFATYLEKIAKPESSLVRSTSRTSATKQLTD